MPEVPWLWGDSYTACDQMDQNEIVNLLKDSDFTAGWFSFFFIPAEWQDSRKITSPLSIHLTGVL
jgi:hypothetical protein